MRKCRLANSNGPSTILTNKMIDGHMTFAMLDPLVQSPGAWTPLDLGPGLDRAQLLKHGFFVSLCDFSEIAIVQISRSV